LKQSFFQLLEWVKDFGSIKSQDFIAYTVPLLEQVNDFHEQNLVANISDPDKIEFTEISLTFVGEPKTFSLAHGRLFLKPTLKTALEVSGAIKETNDLSNQTSEYTSLAIQQENQPSQTPQYLLSYQVWDQQKGLYDPLTEIHILGFYLASLAFNLDFRDKEDLVLFVENRKRLYFLNRELHPTILNVIYEMTSLYREDRTANLQEVITKLNNYREYNPENFVDLTQTEGFRSQDISTRGNWILAKLKNRLFDISRRNKLLYFTDKKSFLNLTISSVPLLLDHNNVQEKDLIFWNETIAKKIIKSKKIELNNYLEFKQNRFLTPTINRIRIDANKSLNEYGFSQLRTVIAFVHWYNFKENNEERITSPLLLLPTEIKKRKGVTDQYSLLFPSSQAEINPILSHYLKELTT
jgi:hypothetical protein